MKLLLIFVFFFIFNSSLFSVVFGPNFNTECKTIEVSYTLNPGVNLYHSNYGTSPTDHEGTCQAQKDIWLIWAKKNFLYYDYQAVSCIRVQDNITIVSFNYYAANTGTVIASAPICSDGEALNMNTCECPCTIEGTRLEDYALLEGCRSAMQEILTYKYTNLGCATCDPNGPFSLVGDSPICKEGEIKETVRPNIFKCVLPSVFPDLVETYPIPDMPGVTRFTYNNGSLQFCNTEHGTCFTIDKNGLKIPNIPINGTIYNDILDREIHRWLSIGSIVIGTVGAATAVIGSGGLAGLGLSAGLHLGIANETWGDTYTVEVNTELNDNAASTEQGIMVNPTTLNFGTESAEVTNTTDTQGNKISTIEDTKKVTFKEEIIEAETTYADGSKQIIVIPTSVLTTPTVKNDFSEVNNLSNVDYIIKNITAPTMNNNGTTTSGTATTTYNTLNTINNITTTNSTQITSATTTPTTISTTTETPATTTSTSTSSTGEVTTTTAKTTTDLKPITDRLDQIINQNTVSNTKLDKIAQESTQKDILDKINKLINTTENGFEDIEADLNTTNKLLKEINDKLGADENNTDENNTDNNKSEGWGIDTLKSKIIEQYGKGVNVFDIDACGAPNFAATIIFMGFEIENPLKIMDKNMGNGMYEPIKTLLLLIATFMGLISVFRK
ncbi:hypothetical protein KKG72_04730 [bacterium]|nr:hypothetical protein [bacterium]